jgi:hypothetical protein
MTHPKIRLFPRPESRVLQFRANVNQARQTVTLALRTGGRVIEEVLRRSRKI